MEISVKDGLEAIGIKIFKEDYEDSDGYYYQVSIAWGKYITDYHPIEAEFLRVDLFYKAYIELADKEA